MKELTILANKYRTDKGTDGPDYHGYTEIYSDYIDKNIKNVLEIGIGGEFQYTKKASSLKMWKEYLPNAKIYGIDVNRSFFIEEDRIICKYCDQSDVVCLTNLMREINNSFDLIIDDGCHNTIYQQITFSTLFQYVASGGLYIIEDLHTSVWGDWGLPANDPNCALNMLTELKNTGKITSKYIDNKKYIEESVKDCEIFFINNSKDHITSIIRKK